MTHDTNISSTQTPYFLLGDLDIVNNDFVMSVYGSVNHIFGYHLIVVETDAPQEQKIIEKPMPPMLPKIMKMADTMEEHFKKYNLRKKSSLCPSKKYNLRTNRKKAFKFL